MVSCGTLGYHLGIFYQKTGLVHMLMIFSSVKINCKLPNMILKLQARMSLGSCRVSFSPFVFGLFHFSWPEASPYGPNPFLSKISPTRYPNCSVREWSVEQGEEFWRQLVTASISVIC